MRASPSARETTAVTRPRLSVSIAGDVDERERDLDHALEIVDGDAFVGGVDVLHPVRQVETGEPALVEDVRVRGTAAEAIAERPSSGYIPEWDARPWKVTSSACEYGAPRMTSPIGAAWSYT